MAMSMFSFTQPRFTEEDENKERSSLNEIEKERICSDLYGSRNRDDTNDASEVDSCDEEDVRRCIQEIPEDDKSEYMEALRTSPHIVESESSALDFLRWANYDAKLAAKRLVRYWKERKYLFGEEKAFLPMRLTEALRDDHEMIRSGIVVLLPDDLNERCVVYLDRNRIDYSHTDRFSLVRSIWYFVHVAMEEKNTITNGIVTIGNFKTETSNTYNRKLSKLMWTSVNECFPIKICSLHACHPPFVAAILFPVLKAVMGRHVRLRFIMHTGTNACIMDRLETYGLEKHGVPESLGGTHSCEVHDWFDDRLRRGL